MNTTNEVALRLLAKARSLESGIGLFLFGRSEEEQETWKEYNVPARRAANEIAEEAAAEITRLGKANEELERLCDATYVAEGADAYNHACSELERFQSEREEAGKEVGTINSLCDGMEWLYERLDELEAENIALKGAPPHTTLYREDEAVIGDPYGCVTTYPNGQQIFSRHPEQPYLDNAVACTLVYRKKDIMPTSPNPSTSKETK